MHAEIVMVTHEFYPRKGGISTYVQEMARCASEMGFKVEVWAPGNPLLLEHSFPYSVKQIPVRGAQGWGDRIRLALFLGKHRKHLTGKILYLPEPGPLRTLMYLQLISLISWRNLVITLHGSEILRFSSPFYRRFLFNKLLKKADRIGVASRYCRKLLAEKFPAVASKAALASGALRADLIPSPESESRAGDRITLLTVGRITPRKGQLRVLHGLKNLPEKVLENVDYWLVGPAGTRAQRNYLREIERYSAANGINLRIWGELDNQSLGEVYGKSDIFLLTSDLHNKSVEGFGLVCLEASAHGLPIVACRSGGLEESVLDGKTGILVAPGDSHELAKAILVLCENKAMRQKLGKAGRLHAARFSWSQNVKTLFTGLSPANQVSANEKRNQGK